MTTTQNAIQAKLAAARAQQEAAKENPEANQAQAELDSVAEEEIVYQQYKSSRPSTRVVTESGIRISFVGFELLTTDPHVMEYLDNQIAKNGLPGITKGEALTLSDRNPMATMERKLRAEIRAEMEAEALARSRGEFKDMGSTDAKGMKVLGTNSLTASAQSGT